MRNQALTLDGAALTPSISTFSHGERVAYLMEHGVHSQSFSTMQSDMEYFDVPGIGYIAYARYWGMQFVLGDPVCEPKYFEPMLTKFLKRFPNALFAQVSKPIVDILHQSFSYYGTQFGSESKVSLSDWNLRGSKKQIIRTAINQARAQGIEIKEGPFDRYTKKISEAWIKTRRCKNNEIRFLIRPMLMDYKENTRYFYAYHNGEAVAYIFFDPLYKNGKLISYVPNISRSCASFKQGLWYAIMVHAMEVFRSEGVPYVDLGLVPLMLADDYEPQESKILRKMMAVIRERGDMLYNFKGLEFAKARFNGVVEKTYCCHRNALPGLAMVAMFRLTRII
ncbi:DUF2156 domain-containing protein [Chitinivorax sp. PXF-14]|uniref:DUF2156 domain-containing protein n=1 Tax=Chitinivorax sp. PXF-14 TaxID=3230488 RepID=UPI0034677687